MRIRGDATVNGSILANGSESGGWTSGDGSGGGIFLDSNGFSGSGTLSANGGAGHAGVAGASGGGGRIAVWYAVSEEDRVKVMGGYIGKAIITSSYTKFTGTVTATNGPYGYAGLPAQPGTIVFLTVPPPIGTVIFLK